MKTVLVLDKKRSESKSWVCSEEKLGDHCYAWILFLKIPQVLYTGDLDFQIVSMNCVRNWNNMRHNSQLAIMHKHTSWWLFTDLLGHYWREIVMCIVCTLSDFLSVWIFVPWINISSLCLSYLNGWKILGSSQITAVQFHIEHVFFFLIPSFVVFDLSDWSLSFHIAWKGGGGGLSIPNRYRVVNLSELRDEEDVWEDPHWN
jgi:hypothetical protein